MAFAPPARHLLRVKDLADARYFEPLSVDDLACAAGLSRAHFSCEFRRTFVEPPEEPENDEEDHLLSLTQRGLFGAPALGVSISFDELAIGFSAGLLRLPIFAMVIAIAAQAFIATQIRVRFGGRVGEGIREVTESSPGSRSSCSARSC